MARLSKQQSRERWGDLRSKFNGWDPIGLLEAGAPADEYECVLGPLMRMFEEAEAADERTIIQFLRNEFREHSGVPSVQDVAEFVRETREWYCSRWPRSTV